MISYYLLPSKINMFLSNLNFTLTFDSSHMMMTMEFNAFGHHLENNWKIHNIFSLLCQMGHHFSSLGFNESVERQMDPGGQRLITHRAPRPWRSRPSPWTMDEWSSSDHRVTGFTRDFCHLSVKGNPHWQVGLQSPQSTRPFDTPPLYGCRR